MRQPREAVTARSFLGVAANQTHATTVPISDTAGPASATRTTSIAVALVASKPTAPPSPAGMTSGCTATSILEAGPSTQPGRHQPAAEHRPALASIAISGMPQLVKQNRQRNNDELREHPARQIWLTFHQVVEGLEKRLHHLFGSDGR